MKTFKQILDEARMIATGDYRISSSGRKVRRLIKVGDDDYNKADDVDKDGDVDANDEKMKKMRGEAVESVDEKRGLWDNIHAKRERIKNGSGERMRKPGSKGAPTAADFKSAQNEDTNLEEATTVKKANYSWGKMMTVHHGADHSYPLHPEHQEAIKNLKHDEKTTFKDETGAKVTAHREGGDVHFTSNRTAKKTTVAHSHFTESADINITNESNEKDDVPFDKPYKTVDKEVTTDKSGAKHTPMSKARHLARMAALQQAKKK